MPAAKADICDTPARKPDFAAVFGTWAEDHADFLHTLRQKMAQNGSGGKKLAENALWDMIADSWSSDWGAARTRLGDAAHDLYMRQKPENIPLGSIGLAMDAGQLDQSEKRYRAALAQFTVINEELRLHAELSHLLEILSTVEESQDMSAAAQKLNNRFKAADQKAAPEQPVRKGFRAYVDFVFRRRRVIAAAAETAGTALPKTTTGTAPTAKF